MDDDRLVIIKACKRLRLTREILVASQFARDTRRAFMLVVPVDCVFTEALEGLVRQFDVKVTRDRSL